jgi:ElaB/YqjD/DUF883 family membrane-anchored ribosome-binding protein
MPRPERVTTPIEAALAHLDEEVTQLRAEQHAFEQFAEQVAALTVASSQPATPPTVTSLTDGPPAATTRAICAAYQETVMALAHYDDVYDDSLTESLATEFGPDIATVLTEEMPVTTLLQQQVCTAATQAASERAAVLETLATERSALETAQDTLTTLGQQAASQTDDAATPDETASPPSLDTLETRCEQLATDRQHQLQTRSLSPHRDGHDIAAYLYQDTDWTYPVLAAVARLSDWLRMS